ncbi:hypothetical protein BDD12DRAFT_911052 [Trichophaea hybrida]|nr:hypothetical protein BDD12DRAFT_911052 [Trichophaea hybrida]
MFSVRDCTMVSHSDGMFSHYSASTNRTYGNHQNDLIAFLSIVQKCHIDFLNITWQPSLSILGQGGTGIVSQSTFNGEMSLAFKRFQDSGDSDQAFLPLMSEVLILSQPQIQSHPNIINIEAICWEIKPLTQKAIPVLVFEKAAWDLKQFMNVHEGMNTSIDDRLKICAEIGSAIMALHAYEVIHGDIKPQNVLVFKDATGKTTVKVSDFGYSTLAAGEEGRVFLPKSRPWNAPEHHFGEFKVCQAKKADVYSFGMLCLWILFGNCLSSIPDGKTELLSFTASIGSQTLLERLKGEDKVEQIANQLILSMPDMNTEHQIRLKEFFSLTVQMDPEKRTSNLGKLVRLFNQEQIELPAHTSNPLEEVGELSWYAGFRIAESLARLVASDYRVRIQIRESLEKNYFRNHHESFAAHIAFQVAFCYKIGFGVKSDDNKCRVWLERSNKQPDDLKAEKEAVRPDSGNSERIRKYDGLWREVDLVHQYRTWGLKKLEEAWKEHEREIDDMVCEFGEFHFIPLVLFSIAGDVLDELREFEKSKALRMRIKDRISTEGVSHPDYIQSIFNVAKSHRMLGEWKDAQLLLEEALQLTESTYGVQSLAATTILCSLSWSLWKQGRWKEAEGMETQVMEKTLRVLGQEHPDTLTSIDNCASIFSMQGRWKEAEELFLKVMETRKKVLSNEHPDTLISMGNLASTYYLQGRWKEAEVLEVQVMETRKKILGEEHPATLDSLGNLASTYVEQGRWKEAEELQVHVMEISLRVFGQQHPSTIISMANLASTYRNRGQWKKAEELEIHVMETSKRILGLEHPDTLTSMNNLASTFLKQGRWKDAEALQIQVMETRKRVLGLEHPDTLTSTNNLASTYQSQGRWTEAEMLEIEAMEIQKRALGQDHPDTLTSMYSLASTFLKQGRWKDAEALQLQVMETFKRVLGQDHPDTLTSMSSLALVYKNLKKWKEVEELEVKVMETSLRVLGPQHPATLTSIGNLASTYRNLGRWKEAEMKEMEVLEMQKTILGQDHPDTLTCMNNLASTYWKQGRWKDAEALQVQVMETFKRVLGQEHPSTLTSMNNLASTFWKEGRWNEAEQLEVEVIMTKKRVLGHEHPSTLTSVSNLALTYKNQERLKEAEELEIQVMESRMRVLGLRHPSTVISISNLVSTYRNQGRLKEVDEIRNKVFNRTSTTLSENHPSTALAITNVALLHEEHATTPPDLSGGDDTDNEELGCSKG